MSIYQPPERQRERERESEADGGRESRHRLEERREGTSVNGRTLAFKSDRQGSPLTPLGPPRLSGMPFLQVSTWLLWSRRCRVKCHLRRGPSVWGLPALVLRLTLIFNFSSSFLIPGSCPLLHRQHTSQSLALAGAQEISVE